jgi:hypothetical protein
MTWFLLERLCLNPSSQDSTLGDHSMWYVWFQSCNESITSVHGGVVGNAGYEEVVASTYTGNVSLYFFIHILYIYWVN